MFAGFNLKLSEAFFDNKINEYVYIGENSNSNLCFDEDMTNCIITKFKEGDSLSGERILHEWFPRVECNVFISHAHDDKRLANAFAGWLYENFHIISFIDSNVWNYIDTLLNMLNEYSDKRPNGSEGWLYDYCKCNRASQHANIMLLMSLQTMIDNVESVFFLNTDNSVNAIDDNGISSTYSPWIYAELMCADLIRKKPLAEYRNKNFLEHFDMNTLNESCAEMQISYNISTSNLKKLNEANLIKWAEQYKNGHNVIPMDLLYKMFVNEVSYGNGSY